MPLPPGTSAACQPRLVHPVAVPDGAAHVEGAGQQGATEVARPVGAPVAALRIGAADDRRDPGLELLGQPDVEVQTERPRDLLGEERPERAPGDPPHHLADEIPVGQRVVAVRRARLPERLLRGQRVNDGVPRPHLLLRQRPVEGGHPAWWVSR